MAFFAYGGRGSTTAMIAANRGHRRKDSFYRTSKISTFSVTRSASSSTVPTSAFQTLQFADVAQTARPKLSMGNDLLSSDKVGMVDLLESSPHFDMSAAVQKKVSLSPESLEKMAWFSSLSSEEEEEDSEEECEITLAKQHLPEESNCIDEMQPTVPAREVKVTEVEDVDVVEIPLKRSVLRDSEESGYSDTSTGNDSQTLSENNSSYEEPSLVQRVVENTEQVNSTQQLLKPVVDENVYPASKGCIVEDEDQTDDEVEDEEEVEEGGQATTARQNIDFSELDKFEAVARANDTCMAVDTQSLGYVENPYVQECGYKEDPNIAVVEEEGAPFALIGDDLCACLTRDIDDMVKWVDDQHENSAFVRHENARLLKTCVKGVLGEGVNLVEYGSSAVGLALPDSDLDYVIVLEKRSNAFNLARPQQVENLEKVAEALSKEPWVHDLSFVSTAGIPVIKYKGVGGRPVDLSCLGLHHHGLRTQHLKEDQIRDKPHLRAIVLILKQLVKDHKIGDKASGGLSSYAIFIIVSCFLSWHIEMTQDVGNQSFSVGWMLLAFLEQHDSLLHYPSIVFTVCGYEARGEAWSQFQYDMMAVSDPYDENRNVTRGFYRLSHFQQVLKEVWTALSHGKRLDSVVTVHPVSQLEPTHQLAGTTWTKPEAEEQ